MSPGQCLCGNALLSRESCRTGICSTCRAAPYIDLGLGVDGD